VREKDALRVSLLPGSTYSLNGRRNTLTLPSSAVAESLQLEVGTSL
jgi:hypothetical protein